jgi:hypothetical protein
MRSSARAKEWVESQMHAGEHGVQAHEGRDLWRRRGRCGEHATPQFFHHDVIYWPWPTLLLLFASTRHRQSLLHDRVGHIQLTILFSLIRELDIWYDADVIDIPSAGRKVVRGRQAQPGAILEREDGLDRPFPIALGPDNGRLLQVL